MPKKLSTIAGTVFGLSVFVYVAIVVTTVSLASYQTELQGSVADAEASIGTLESKYYDAVAVITSEDASALGYVAPKNIAYAKGAAAPVLTAAF
jgi:hypothetical protein